MNWQRFRLVPDALGRLWLRASDDPYADPDLAKPYPFPDPPAPGVDPASPRENDQERIDENPLDNPEGYVRQTHADVVDIRSFYSIASVARVVTGRHGPLGGAVLDRPVDSQVYIDADQEPGL